MKIEKPKVGDGATIQHYSDRTACTVIFVSESGKTLVLQEDRATRTDDNGMSDQQSYAYERDPRGAEHRVRLCKDGWRVLGKNYLRVDVGVRSKYHDYSF